MSQIKVASRRLYKLDAARTRGGFIEPIQRARECMDTIDLGDQQG